MDRLKKNLLQIFDSEKEAVFVHVIEKKSEQDGNGQSNYTRFFIGPLELGVGNIVANTVQRILKTEFINTPSIVHVQVQNEFEYSDGEFWLYGVKESLKDIFKNLKEIKFKTDNKNVVFHGRILVKGPAIIRARDIVLPTTPSIEVLNPEQHIAEITEGRPVDLEVRIAFNKEFYFYNESDFEFYSKSNLIGPSKEKEQLEGGSWTRAVQPKGFLLEPKNPIIKTNYMITNLGRYREDMLTNHGHGEAIFFEIWTNEEISPLKAIKEAVRILIHYHVPILKLKDELDEQEDGFDDPEILAKMGLEQLNLAKRFANFFLKKSIENLSIVKSTTMKETRKIPGFLKRDEKYLSKMVNNIIHFFSKKMDRE